MPEDDATAAGTTTDLAGLVDAAPDAVVVVDRAGVIVLVNRQTEVLFGHQRSELVGQSIEILVPEGLRDFHARHRQRFVDQPRVRPMGTGLDLRARRKDGTEFRVEIALGPFQSHGEPMVSASIRDATHKRGEERLFRALVEAAPDAMVIVDESGRIVLVNGQLEELFGYQRSELEGRPVEILMPDRFVGMHVGYRAGFMANPTRRPMGIARDLVAGGTAPSSRSRSPWPPCAATRGCSCRPRCETSRSGVVSRRARSCCGPRPSSSPPSPTSSGPLWHPSSAMAS
jgi:PAS domain S-box-containing protein